MSSSIVAWIATYLLHSTLLVIGALLLDRWWHDRPERMSAVWKTALLGGLLTASVQTGMGGAAIGEPWVLAAPTRAVDASPPQSPAVSVDQRLHTHAPMPAVMPLPERVPLSIAPTMVATHSTPSEPPPTAGWLLTLVPWVLTVLVIGAVMGLLSVIAALVALRRQLRGRRPLVEGALPQLLEALRQRADVRRSVPLTVAPSVCMPMAVGVVRPEIVVPPQATVELSVVHQKSLLAHELAHVLRRDPAWRLLGLLVRRVLFFQPLNHLTTARLSQTAEYLCDDWAARHTRQPLALASCLTEIATWVAQPGPVAAGMAGPRSILGRRVHRLLSPGRSSRRPVWLRATLGLPLLGLIVAAPGVTTQARAESASLHPATAEASADRGRDEAPRADDATPVLAPARRPSQTDGAVIPSGAVEPEAPVDSGHRHARTRRRKIRRARARAAEVREHRAPPEALELHVIIPRSVAPPTPDPREAFEALVHEDLERRLRAAERQLRAAEQQLEQQLEHTPRHVFRSGRAPAPPAVVPRDRHSSDRHRARRHRVRAAVPPVPRPPPPPRIAPVAPVAPVAPRHRSPAPAPMPPEPPLVWVTAPDVPSSPVTPTASIVVVRSR